MNTIELTGKIHFDPEDKTKKHIDQSSWKKVAMVLFSGEICEYYSWYITKRYNITLLKPLRGAHISFINDSFRDMQKSENLSMLEVSNKWDNVKTKWDGKTVNIVLDLDPRTDDRTWWLNVPREHRGDLQGIRNELGLGVPFYGMHMSIGYAHPHHENHSRYIHTCIKNGFIN